MGGIDEAALDRLSLVTEMSKRIAVRAEDESSGGAGAAALGATSPHFLWLLRDFFLNLSEDGESITAKDYLELALTQVKGSNAAVAAKNQIRESIRSLFPLRDCYTLVRTPTRVPIPVSSLTHKRTSPYLNSAQLQVGSQVVDKPNQAHTGVVGHVQVRPMNDEAALQNLGAQSLSSMRPEFQAGMTALLDRVYAKALPKRLGSSVLTGPMLAGLASTYVDAINNGAVPVIATAWQVRQGGEKRCAGPSEGPFGTEDGRLFKDGRERSPSLEMERPLGPDGSWRAQRILGFPYELCSLFSVKLMEVERET